MGIDLAAIWAIVILIGVLIYVILDGFDLGVGILFLSCKDNDERDTMINSIAPVWDGNETWLVLGGAGLLAAFPVAYATLLSAFYIPVIAMLIGLIFRGVAFEFRERSHINHKRSWDRAFCAGSLLAALSQGVILGALIDGPNIVNGEFAGHPLDCITPFSLLTALGVVIAYSLLGACWLIIKTRSELQCKVRTKAKALSVIMLLLIIAVSIITPLNYAAIAERWFTLPNLFWLAPVPLLVLVFFRKLGLSLNRVSSEYTPFISALCLVLLGYLGLVISIWPNILPNVSIWQAAAPQSSLLFSLLGAFLILPVILTYTAWSYYVFRGKSEDSHYEH